MKTILIYDQLGLDAIKFLVVDGDYSHLNGVYINSTETSNEDADALNALTFFPEGHPRAWEYLDDFLTEFPKDVIIQNPDTKIIVCGFIP